MIQADTLIGKPDIRHAFFTREGGVSEGIYASRNCGPGSDDLPANVTENRGRCMADLDLPPVALVTVHQVHSPRAVVLERPWPPGQAPEADALVTRTAGLALGILTADCGPILLADAEAKVIGAAHAGWRGARGGVLEATVEAMTRIGAERERIVAVVGPCIGPDSYEVGADMRTAFDGDETEPDCFFRPAERAGHYLFDLPGYLVHRLESTGIGGVSVTGHDTLPDDARFFSYRRTTLSGGTDYGRQLSAIALAP